MAEYATAEFKLERIPKGGNITVRTSLEQVAKSTGKRPKDLDHGKPLPEELVYLWEWFVSVHSNERLSYSELNNWSDLKSVNLRPWEVDAIMKLERIYWSTVNGS